MIFREICASAEFCFGGDQAIPNGGFAIPARAVQIFSQLFQLLL